MFSVTQAYLKINTCLVLMRVKNWVIKAREKNQKTIAFTLGLH